MFNRDGLFCKERVLRVVSLEEKDVLRLLKGLDREGTHIRLIPGNYGVDIKLQIEARNEQVAASLLSTLEEEVRRRLGDNIYGVNNETLERIVGYLLYLRRLTLSIAESCTGGLVSNLVTNVSGSSKYFKGGIVAYSNESKIKFLRVPKEIIERFGAVSQETARFMAKGVKDAFSTDIGIGITGIAGPTGGTSDKPVGLTYISLSSKNGSLCRMFTFKGSREDIKFKASYASLDIIRRKLQD
ncbi:MAG: nicotinamide-nucleotide amidohydrolase family protein [bacterium]|nr:nicotinamide-nucleotide amidohydrolase family protein [bacterium]